MGEQPIPGERPSPQLSAGQRHGRYLVEGLLGTGAMAEIYRVRHQELGVLRALKLLCTDHPVARTRLIREGRVLGGLVHPHVLRVYDVLEIEGRPALVMDFLPGGSIAERMRGEPLPLPLVRRWLQQLLDGLEALHELGVVHRDLKPHNLLLDAEEQLVIADLGLAREEETDPEEAHLTRGGMGSPAWVAPEQLWQASAVDARADLWAVGAILYAWLSGSPPYGSGEAVLRGDPLPLPELPASTPPDLEAVLRACLVPRPAERAAEVASLRSLLGQTGPSTPTPAEPTPRADERSALGRATALVVDERGQGRAVEIVVQLLESGTRVQCAAQAAADTEVAAQLAIAAALRDLPDRSARWSVRGHEAAALRGTSIGLALAVAARSAALGKEIPSGHAFTGRVDLDGGLGQVRGLPAKLRAAQRAGISQVWVPSGGELPAGARPARHLDEVLQPLGLGRGPRRLRWLSLLLPPLLAFTALSAPVDAWMHASALRLARGSLPMEEVVVLSLPDTRDLRALRSEHAEVIDGLVSAGATAIVLDLALSASDPQDEVLARSILRAQEQGVPVILPVVFREGHAQPPGSAALRQSARLGTVEVRQALDVGWVRGAPARRHDLQGQAYWHVSALAATAHLGSDQPPRRENGQLISGPARNPISRDGSFWLPPTAEPQRLPYADPQSWAEARGRVALIGLTRGSQDVLPTSEGPRYGVEVLASLVQTLVRQAAPSRAPLELDALLALLTGLGTATLSRALRPSRRLLAAAVPLGTLALVLALAAGSWLFAWLPLALAGALGLWVARE